MFLNLRTTSIHVSISIRVSEANTAKLERIKRKDETFEGLLDRLADIEDTMQDSTGTWAGSEKAKFARESRERVLKGFR